KDESWPQESTPPNTFEPTRRRCGAEFHDPKTYSHKLRRERTVADDRETDWSAAKKVLPAFLPANEASIGETTASTDNWITRRTTSANRAEADTAQPSAGPSADLPACT